MCRIKDIENHLENFGAFSIFAIIEAQDDDS